MKKKEKNYDNREKNDKNIREMNIIIRTRLFIRMFYSQSHYETLF